jgi:two-component system response regulator DesR
MAKGSGWPFGCPWARAAHDEAVPALREGLRAGALEPAGGGALDLVGGRLEPADAVSSGSRWGAAPNRRFSTVIYSTPLAGRAVRVIRVLIAEDQGMVRGALASLLTLEPDIEVVAEVARGDEVLAAVQRTLPDVALLDIEMPGATGLEAAEGLRAAGAGCRVLILTTFGRPGYLRRAMEGGASGFLLKDAPASELASAIRRAMAGERIVDPGLAAAALSVGECPLTPREHEVLAASRDHATVAELASALHLSPGTVRNHLSSVMQKLDARNRGEAVKRAEEQGWL